MKFKVVILIILLTSCNNPDKNKDTSKIQKVENTFMKAYSGGYTIEIKGQVNSGDAELYLLAENGKAQWMYLKTIGRKEPEIVTRKYGIWTASDSYLKISIDGTSGPIVEEYQMNAGTFYNKATPDRYLQRTK